MGRRRNFGGQRFIFCLFCDCHDSWWESDYSFHEYLMMMIAMSNWMNNLLLKMIGKTHLKYVATWVLPSLFISMQLIFVEIFLIDIQNDDHILHKTTDLYQNSEFPIETWILIKNETVTDFISELSLWSVAHLKSNPDPIAFTQIVTFKAIICHLRSRLLCISLWNILEHSKSVSKTTRFYANYRLLRRNGSYVNGLKTLSVGRFVCDFVIKVITICLADRVRLLSMNSLTFPPRWWRH